MSIPGVPGDSTEERHRDWIEALGIVGIRVESAATGGGQQQPTSAFGEFVLLKQLDRATPGLLNAVAAGTQFSPVRVEVCGAIAEQLLCFLAYELQTAFVTSVAPGAVETVSLGFARVRQTFTEFDATGAARGTVQGEVNLLAVGARLVAFDPPSGAFVAVPGATDVYARLFGFAGSSVDADHQNWSDVTSVGGGAVFGSNPISVNDISLVKPVDKASPRLLVAAANGQRGTVEIEFCRRGGETPFCPVRYVLGNALITGISTAGVTETITLSFQQLRLDFVFLDATGHPRPPVTVDLDLTGR